MREEWDMWEKDFIREFNPEEYGEASFLCERCGGWVPVRWIEEYCGAYLCKFCYEELLYGELVFDAPWIQTEEDFFRKAMGDSEGTDSADF